MIQALEEMLRAPESQLANRSTPWHFMKLGAEEYPEASTPFLLLAFAGTARSPLAVIKIARTAAGDALVTHEAAMLARAHAQLPPTSAALVPRLVRQGSLNGRAFVAMTALPGEIEMHHTWGARRVPHERLRAGVQWILDAAGAAPAPAIDPATWLGPQAVDAVSADAAPLGIAAAMRQRLEERLGPVWTTPWPAGLAHGDYFPGNLLFRGRTLSGVVDWALAVERAPVFFDVLTYELSFAVGAVQRGHAPAAREWRAVHALPAFAAARARLAALGVSAIPGGAARVATLVALHASARRSGRQSMCQVFARLLGWELEISPAAAGG